MQQQLIARAKKDIDIISNEVSDLLYHEDVYQTRTKPLIKSKKIDHHSAGNIAKTHYTSMLIAVRRQIGRDKGEISLLNLLEKLKENSKLITKDWYAKEWLKDSSLVDPKQPKELAGFIQHIPIGEFEEYFGSESLDPGIVEGDIRGLKKATSTIKTFVDKRIAHRDKVSPKNIKEKEYLESLKVIEKITSKYILLLKQVGMSRLKPVIQN